MGARVVRTVVTTGVSLGLLAACGLDVGGLGDTSEGGAADEAGSDAGASVDGRVTAEGSPGDDAWAGTDAHGAADALIGLAEGGPASDALAEAAIADGPLARDGACPGVTCNGACSPDPDCRACAGAPLLCASTGSCAADCSACAASPVECFACDTSRRNPLGTCQPDDPQRYCLDTYYGGAYAGVDGEHCGCTLATDCPGADQVCILVGGTTAYGCFTCGEAYTQGFDCRNGGKCNAQQLTCN
jgi:hypothetical protein